MNLSDEDKIEQDRHRCEVRYLLKLAAKHKGWGEVNDYVNDKLVSGRAELLKKDVKYQYTKGNRGKHGEWYD